MWLVGALPSDWAQTLLIGTAGVMWLMGLALLGRQFGRTGMLVGLATLSGAVLPCLLDEIYIMPEVWAGVLIGLSAVAYGMDRPRLGCLAALAALLIRELSAPWCLVCLLFDMRKTGRRAAVVWAIGFAIYGVLYALHLTQAVPRILTTDLRQAQGWVRFGGAGFLISTVQMNVWLLLLPQWLSAIYLALACSAPPAGRRRRAGGSPGAWSCTRSPFRSPGRQSINTGARSPPRFWPFRPPPHRQRWPGCGRQPAGIAFRSPNRSRSGPLDATRLRSLRRRANGPKMQQPAASPLVAVVQRGFASPSGAASPMRRSDSRRVRVPQARRAGLSRAVGPDGQVEIARLASRGGCPWLSQGGPLALSKNRRASCFGQLWCVKTHPTFSSPRRFDSLAQAALDLIGVGVGELLANPFAGDVARQFVQIERDPQSLFACHRSIKFELSLEGRVGVHRACRFAVTWRRWLLRLAHCSNFSRRRTARLRPSPIAEPYRLA